MQYWNIFESIVLLGLVFALDFLFGDPVYALHPTRIIGKTVTLFEKILFSLGFCGIVGGFLLVFLVNFIVVAFYLVLVWMFGFFGHYFVFLLNVYIVYSVIALKDMFTHADRVYNNLKNEDIEKAKSSVGMIVGRDVSVLDETGIVKATIESLSENFVDGFLSVVFWYCLFSFMGFWFGFDCLISGTVGALIYRAVNTMDSMVGYKNERYMYFGRIAARLDDILNFIPARLSVFIICLASFILGRGFVVCIKTAKNDRLKHASCNSAHAESAISGALKIKLGGRTVYPYGTIDKPFIGEGFDSPEIKDIKRAEEVLFVSSILSLFSAFIFIYISFGLLKNSI